MCRGGKTFRVSYVYNNHLVLAFLCIGANKLIIKRIPASGVGEKLLTVGAGKVAPDQRLSITSSRLFISHTRPRDAGTYICHFDLEPPVQLIHTLKVHYPPTVRSLVPLMQRVPRGSSVVLKCESNGNPDPVIRWTRQGGRLPSGDYTVEVSSVCVYVCM